MKSIDVSIQGMHCGGCAAKVSTALKSIPGATVENVAMGSARVSIDPKMTSSDVLIAAIDKLGFKAALA